MKLALKSETVFKLFREMQGTEKYGPLGPKAPNPQATGAKFISFSGPNYVVYDDHKDAPPGFALRIGRTSAVFLVDKRVAGRKLKIPVGLAAGKKGTEKVMSLTEARDQAWGLAQLAKKHGMSPKDVSDQIEASELTLGDVWETYLKFLKSKQPPIKLNSELSLNKARQKFKDWEHRKVRLISAKEVLERFDHHAVEMKHRTAAEAMGRWATAAVDKAIEREIHDAHSAMRPPSLTYNPFTILRTEGKYRSNEQLEREYKVKGIRNPLSFTNTVGPYVRAIWDYRKQNPVSADFIFLTMLWGMRQGESATMQWRDRITDAEAAVGRWVDIERAIGFVGDAKNRGDHEFPIAKCAIELLKRSRADQEADQQWLFPTSSPMSTKPYLSDPSQALKTIKENAGLKVVRGHDLRCTFGAACEKLGFSDRQTKRMLGHAVAGGESVGRYTGPEWKDLTDRMARIEELTLSKAPSVHNTLRPKNAPRMHDPACQHCQGAVAAPLAASSNQQLIFRLSRHTTRQGVFAARLRNNEHEDEGHGVLGSALAKHLKGKFFDATDHEMDLLCYVCEHHSDGMVQGDPTVLTCWDADRLDLWRVSIVPKASYLGTAAARTDVVMSKANRRAQVWSDVYDARHDNNWP